MVRPSLLSTRVNEILVAFEACILNKGIDATSLEDIAKVAKMKRSILRHYLGNKDEIICALVRRWTEKYTQQWQELIEYLPTKNRSYELVNSLFSIRNKTAIKQSIIADAIFSKAKHIKYINEKKQEITTEFIENIKRELKHEFPTSKEITLDFISYNIYSNYLLYEYFLPLKLIDQMYKLKEASLYLLKDLNR